ncbi:MAG: hypothetical protein WD275_04210 [Rhodothermales bacterium]
MANQADRTGEGPVSESPSEPKAGRKKGANVQLRGIASLERLRDRVDVAAHELKRLREENEGLRGRVGELEARPNVSTRDSVPSIEHDPEVLRKKIGGFIEAIDRYLERERSRS